MVEKILNDTTPYGKIRASHEGSLHSSTLNFSTQLKSEDCGDCGVNVTTIRNILHERLVGWLCLTSHRQRGHLETAPPFTVPCEGREAR